MPLLVKCWMHKHENVNSAPSSHIKTKQQQNNSLIVAHNGNASAGEAQIDAPLGLLDSQCSLLGYSRPTRELVSKKDGS